MQVRLTAIATAGALLISVEISAALAGSVTQPGERVGIAAGTPLSPGLYFANTADWGCRNTTPASCLGITIPIVHSVDAMDGSRGELPFYSVTPVIEIGVQSISYNASVFNPALLGQLARSLGGGFGFSYAFGAYSDVDQSVAFSSTSLNQRFALSYTGNDWNLTANVIHGIQLDQVTNRPQISPCPAPFGFNGCNPGFINIDLTAIKKFGKWQLGPVAYGSSNLTHPIASYQQQTQFAVGGLFGYDFGPLALQAYATTDVAEHNYGGPGYAG
jgi:hypothetical protein